MSASSITKRISVLKGHLSTQLSGPSHYELVVIGGGSGGIACAKEGKSFHVCDPFSYTVLYCGLDH